MKQELYHGAAEETHEEEANLSDMQLDDVPFEEDTEDEEQPDTEDDNSPSAESYYHNAQGTSHLM